MTHGHTDILLATSIGGMILMLLVWIFLHLGHDDSTASGGAYSFRHDAVEHLELPPWKRPLGRATQETYTYSLESQQPAANMSLFFVDMDSYALVVFSFFNFVFVKP